MPRVPFSFTFLSVLFIFMLAGCTGVANLPTSSGPTPSPTPSIVAAPASQMVAAGKPATFSVDANGAAPLSYQWQKDNTDIVGAVASSYSTPATTIKDNGSKFQVIVSNPTGSVASPPATLTVVQAEVAPAITAEPASKTVTAGQTATFSVTASGTAPLTYQWQKKNKNISGATSATYTTAATTEEDNGSSYRVVVENSAGSVTSSAAILTVNNAPTAAAPAITAQPVSKTVTAGQTATFTVAASGTAPLTYQWQKNNSNISGATSASYTTAATTTGDSGSAYRVMVGNSAGSVTSSAATLTVNNAPTAAAPAITAQPVSKTVTAGQTATFTVAASGTAPLTYQWQKNNSNISGATSASYTTAATTTGDSGSAYRVVVGNSAGSVTSSAATLTVNNALTAAAPAITAQPVSKTVTAGQTATFTVAATGKPLTYQWQKNNSNISGATSASYTTAATTTGDSGSAYRVMVGNSAGSVTSSAATLTVNNAPTAAAPAITAQPVSKTVTAGQTATFTVAASGTAPLTYQWQKNNSNISGATSASYTTAATTTGDSGSAYRVMVGNSAGSVTSSAATLTVNNAPTAAAPAITAQPVSKTVTAGQTATFTVAASGTAPLTYQWQKNNSNISGATSASYTTAATTTGDSGSAYRVVVGNSAGSVTSSAATLTVNNAPTAAAPAITAQPVSKTVTAGQTATFTVAASGTAPLTYQWQKNNSNISGATSASYTTAATTTGDSGSAYRVMVGNSAGSVTSSTATLTVNSTSLNSYTTNFPLTENPISESGNWINGGSVGLAWSNVRTTPGLAFGTESGSGGYDDSTAVLAGSWSADQMAQAVVHSTNQNSNVFEEVELRLRTTIAANRITGYEFNFRALASGDIYVQIVRWNGAFGSFSLIDSLKGPGIHNGDVIKATAVGNILTSYVNGNQILQVTDSTYNSGSPGMGFFNQSGTASLDSNYGFSSFTAAELSGNAPATQIKAAAEVAPPSLAGSSSAQSTHGSTSSTVNVLTYRNDNARSGQNVHETLLSPANVSVTSFGKKAFLPVLGAVDAEPLYVSNLLVGGLPHSVVLVATEQDMLYAFDADTFSQLWRVSLLGPNETPSDNHGCDPSTPEFGISATPVIDLSAGPHGTVFLATASRDDHGNYFQRLHALDLSTGAEQSASPITIEGNSANSAATPSFDPSQFRARAGLLLLNGAIFINWAPVCDATPSSGLVMGFSQTTLKLMSLMPASDIANSGSLSVMQPSMVLADSAAPGFSSNGSSDGIAWTVDTSAGSGILHAYDEANLANELYNGSEVGSRDQMLDNKPVTPMIANGKVFVGTSSGVAVFTLLN